MLRIAWLSDDIRLSTGYGVQSRYILSELSKDYDVVSIGSSVGHIDRSPIMLGERLKVYPVQTTGGTYGTFHELRQILLHEKPNITILFSDPHYVTHAFALEREIHACGPLVFWHLWDNDPYPSYNDQYYDCCDAIACGSRFVYDLIKDRQPKATYLPLGVDTDLYHPEGDEHVAHLRDDFVRRWPALRQAKFFVVAVNRNAVRKRMNDILMAFDMFAEKHDDVGLLMHANIQDMEGAPLVGIRDLMNHKDKVILSHAIGQPAEYVNDIYNFGHVHVTMSANEGYGLTTREALAAGCPVITPMTGGLTESAQQYHTASSVEGAEHGSVSFFEEFGAILEPSVRMLAGSQITPYLYVDYVKTEDVALALESAYVGRDVWKLKGLKGREHIVNNYDIKNTITMWKQLIEKTIQDVPQRSYTELQVATV